MASYLAISIGYLFRHIKCLTIILYRFQRVNIIYWVIIWFLQLIHLAASISTSPHFLRVIVYIF